MRRMKYLCYDQDEYEPVINLINDVNYNSKSCGISPKAYSFVYDQIVIDV